MQKMNSQAKLDKGKIIIPALHVDISFNCFKHYFMSLMCYIRSLLSTHA